MIVYMLLSFTELARMIVNELELIDGSLFCVVRQGPVNGQAAEQATRDTAIKLTA